MMHRVIPARQRGLDINPKREKGKLLKFPGTPTEIIMGIEHGIETKRTNHEFYKPIEERSERRKRMADELRRKSKKAKPIKQYIAFIDLLSYVDLKNAEKHITKIDKSGETVTRDDIEIADFAVTEALKTGAFNPVSLRLRTNNYLKSGQSLNTFPKISRHFDIAKKNIMDAIKRLEQRRHIKNAIQNQELIGKIEKYMQECDEFGGLEYVEGVADGMNHGFPLQGGELVTMNLQANKIDIEQMKKLIQFINNNRKALIEKIAKTTM